MSFSIWETKKVEDRSSPPVVVPLPSVTEERRSGNSVSSTWDSSSIQSAQPKVEETKEEETSWLWNWGGTKKAETNVTKPGFGWANRKTMCPKPDCTPRTHDRSHETPVIQNSSSADVQTENITPVDTPPAEDDRNAGLFT